MFQSVDYRNCSQEEHDILAPNDHKYVEIGSLILLIHTNSWQCISTGSQYQATITSIENVTTLPPELIANPQCIPVLLDLFSDVLMLNKVQ